MKDLRGRVAVVTGAASGIGRALAVRLAEKGCHLALVDVNEAGLAEVSDLVRWSGKTVSVHVADVSNRDRMAALPGEILAIHGRVHVLVNNAGVAVGATLAEHDLDDFEWIVGINFWGVVYGCKFFLPHLEEQDEAHIVNVSSMFGFLGLPGQGAYCATKAAVRALSESLWTELAHTGVKVTSVHPGGIRTNIASSSRTLDEQAKLDAMRLFDRWGTPPEVAADRIVRAIERGQERLLICPEAYVSDVLKRLFPVRTHRLITWAFQRSPAFPRIVKRPPAAASREAA